MKIDTTPLKQLPLKHQLFVLGYITYKGDKTKAARFAGYSEKTAKEQGYRLFTKVHHHIERLTQETISVAALSAEQVLKGLTLIASSDIGNYIQWDHETKSVRYTPWDQPTPEQRYSIESIEQHETESSRTIRIRLAKKQPALETLAMYHGLLKPKGKNQGLVVNISTIPNSVSQGDDVRKVFQDKRKLKVSFSKIQTSEEPVQTGQGTA